MRTHQDIDARSLAMARAIVATIDADPARAGLVRARAVCERWALQRDQAACREWRDLLQRPWSEVKAALLDESETGRRRRQSTPFCGILTPRERWQIYKSFQRHEEA